MDRTVYGGSIGIALVLIAGSLVVPDSAMMWLASTSLVMNIARLALIGIMVGLLLTDPPRSRAFRLLLGIVAIGFSTWAIERVFSGTVQVVDALLFLAAAVSLGLAAIEAEPLPAPALATEVVIDDEVTVAAHARFSDSLLLFVVARLLPRRMAVAVLVASTMHVSKGAARNLLTTQQQHSGAGGIGALQLAGLPP